jgi:hypothetical protein
MKFFLVTTILCLTTFTGLFSQDSSRTIPAVRTQESIKIDGELNDEAWKTAPLATGFFEQRPTFGKAEEYDNRTEVKIIYDDNAIYISGYCHERSRDSISTELVGRDVIRINDFVGVIFDTYLDKINGFGYYVTPLGEQFDAKYSLGNEDASWNSVYNTATKIVDDGWIFEMEIPYSAIRFSKQEVQTWGINITRKRTKSGKQYMWNPVDPNKFGFLNQFGKWEGIENIKPPLRLSFSPYFATYATHNAKTPGSNKWSTSINGGMDVKYGITKAFTLDMTLIPDFGQVQSDNQVLNLTPFEVKFNENRTFFTEGTELFNKGNFFYSRRIGGRPLHHDDIYRQLLPNEKVLKNPSETKLLNATKISGRTAGGLGIGVFNAITNPQYALVGGINGKEDHEVETDPLTNYSVIVLDQTMKNNSSVSFVNTNVWRSGSDYDANVSAVLWDVYDKNIDWNFYGKAATSNLFGYEKPGKAYTGYLYNINLAKMKGPLNFNIFRSMADNKYQQNDLGYFNNNNFLDHGFWVGYKWLKPKSFYNNLYYNFNVNYSQRYLPRSYQRFSIHTNLNGQLKNLWNVGITADFRPQGQDFYEPRMAGKMFKTPTSFMAGFWINSNRAKKYSAGFEMYNRLSPKYKTDNREVIINNRFRFNDKFSIGLSHFLGFYHNNLGYAFTNNSRDSIFFGTRARRTAENTFDVKYNFNNKMGITLRARHYWSRVDYNAFYNLKDDGYLNPVNSISRNPNTNVNFFNVDMIYTWQFAPGSFINISWKNTTDAFDQQVNDRYFTNLKNTVSSPQLNSFSCKVIYYLDYLQLKRKG